MSARYNNYSSTFHPTCGENIRLSNTRKTATCTSAEEKQRFVFSALPIEPGQMVNIRLLNAFSNRPFGFGFTTLDPGNIEDVQDFHQLKLDQDTWTHDLQVVKLDSVVSFWFNDDGDTGYSYNGKTNTFSPRNITTEYLMWALMYLRGNSAQIRIAPKPDPVEVVTPQISASASGISSSHSIPGGDEMVCKICYNARIDSVVYRCGHACMCMTCAGKQWDGKPGSGCCPICKGSIVDVIKLLLV